MVLLESDIIKIKILKKLEENNGDTSMNKLRQDIGLINFNSLKRGCEFLDLCNLIKIEIKTIENKKYNFISISKEGRNLLKVIEKNGK